MQWNEFFFRRVYLNASKSKDPRTKVGAVLVKDNVGVSDGYNGFCRGVADTSERLEYRPLKHRLVVHAEHNAVLNAARHGVNTSGTILYTNGTPCSECCKAVVQAGISEIWIHAPWEKLFEGNKHWNESVRLSRETFKEVGINILCFDQILGIDSLCDGRIVRV